MWALVIQGPHTTTVKVVGWKIECGAFVWYSGVGWVRWPTVWSKGVDPPYERGAVRVLVVRFNEKKINVSYHQHGRHVCTLNNKARRRHTTRAGGR